MTWLRNRSPMGSSARRRRRSARRPAVRVDIGSQERLVLAEGLLVSPARSGELARQHVGGDHGEGRALPGHQGDAERGIPDEGYAASRPAVHPDLADAVEIELLRAIELVEDARAFPLAAPISLAQHGLLQIERRGRGPLSAAKTNRNSVRSSCSVKRPSIRPGSSVHHIHVLVARTVTPDLERRDHVAELLLEPVLRSEGEPANVRMQTIGADHQVEPALAGMFEVNLHAVRLLLKADDLVVENDFRRAVDLLEQQPGQVAAAEGDDSARRSALGTPRSRSRSPARLDRPRSAAHACDSRCD